MIQEHAIDLLICGKTDREVAEALGIHRVTVTRWRLYHPGFQAALNARRAVVWDTIKDRIRALLLDATDAIGAELKSPGPARASLALHLLELRGMPSGNLGMVGPTDPDDIVDEAAARVDRRERMTRLFMKPGELRSTVRDELLTLANEPPGPEVDTTVTP